MERVRSTRFTQLFYLINFFNIIQEEYGYEIKRSIPMMPRNAASAAGSIWERSEIRSAQLGWGKCPALLRSWWDHYRLSCTGTEMGEGPRKYPACSIKATVKRHLRRVRQTIAHARVHSISMDARMLLTKVIRDIYNHANNATTICSRMTTVLLVWMMHAILHAMLWRGWNDTIPS